MIDSVILDLGNVLAFHDNAHLFRALAAAFALSDAEVHARLSGGLWDRVNRGQLPGDALRREIAARLGGTDTTLTPDAWLALWNCHFTVNDAMVAHVARLVGRVRLVLLSNTNDAHFAFLRPRLPVLERFDALVLSHALGLAKPDPAIYHRALAAAGVAPERAVFFDDIPAFVVAAEAAGLPARVFTDAAHFPAQLAALGLDLEAPDALEAANP